MATAQMLLLTHLMFAGFVTNVLIEVSTLYLSARSIAESQSLALNLGTPSYFVYI